MLRNKINIKILVLLSLLISGVIMTACDNDDDAVGSAVQLNSFGPSPALRGGELKFIGVNLDKVTAIVLPANVEVSTFKTKTPNLLIIDVPEETVDGKVILKTPYGDIESKSLLGISEPITIESITPIKVRPSEKVTIKGTYLNLIKEIIFSTNKSVVDFESQSKSTIEVIVPEDAQTGVVTLSNGEEIPILVESESELEITLPVATGISPNPVRPGEDLTITGTDLDLTVRVIFAGGSSVAHDAEEFELKEDGSIVVTVPENAQDGRLQLVSASLVESPSTEDLTIVVPAITNINPNPAKNSGEITVTGENLDLVTSVMFDSFEMNEDEETPVKKAGEVMEGGTASEIKIKVPADAIEGIVVFNTAANKSIESNDVLKFIEPSITSFTPTSVNTIDEPSITINGTDLDLVAEVVFGGDFKAEVVDATETSITIAVPPGSMTGKITLVTTNGTEVESSGTLTIVPDVPNVDAASIPEFAKIGSKIILTGTNMDVDADIYFPGNVVATRFGRKDGNTIEVYVPAKTTPMIGRIRFVTSKNEIYETPELEFGYGGVDPIADASLIINDFDEDGDHSLDWDGWGAAVELLYGDPGPGISDNGNYFHGKGPVSGWTWLWGCNHPGLPKLSVSKADHLFKIDVYMTIAPPADANFKFRFNGSEVSLGNFGASETEGWTTLTWDLSKMGDLPEVINPTDAQDGEWGLIYDGSEYDLSGFYADNFRFEAK